MRRVLATLKYLPALLCGLLVVAWVVSAYYAMAIGHRNLGLIAIVAGTASVRWLPNASLAPRFFVIRGPITSEDLICRKNGCLGEYELFWHNGDIIIGVPMAVIISLLLPLAVGPFTHFRFPLWSYFAYTALVAAELAYYLR
jgi:hypothetical protein